MLEAASHGLPVVATREGGPADIVADLGHGLCVPPRDVDAIEAALLKLLDDRAFWAEASEAGRAHVGRYDWSKWAEDVQHICEDIRHAAPVTTPAPVLLASDIDNTLTGCAPSAALFNAWIARDRPLLPWPRGAACRRPAVSCAIGTYPARASSSPLSGPRSICPMPKDGCVWMSVLPKSLTPDGTGPGWSGR